MDWKDALAGMRNEMPEEEAIKEVTTSETGGVEISGKKREKLNIFVEKKGRNGKVATIIEGFLGSDKEIEDIARLLKQKIGTGGSARGGEILIQGEWREKVAQLLREMGFVIKN